MATTILRGLNSVFLVDLGGSIDAGLRTIVFIRMVVLKCFIDAGQDLTGNWRHEEELDEFRRDAFGLGALDLIGGQRPSVFRPTLELPCEGRGRGNASPTCDGRVSMSSVECRVMRQEHGQERASRRRDKCDARYRT